MKDTIKKDPNKENLRDAENLANWGTTDRLLVQNFEEEREFRKELVDSLRLLGIAALDGVRLDHWEERMQGLRKFL